MTKIAITKVAIIGASGKVGQQIIELISSSKDDNITAVKFASPLTAGKNDDYFTL